MLSLTSFPFQRPNVRAKLPPGESRKNLPRKILWGAISLFCLLFLVNTADAQVPTVVLNGASIGDYVPFYSEDAGLPVLLPGVDVQAALAEDVLNGVEIPRFGIKIPVSVSKADGTVKAYNDHTVWKKAFSSVDAKSLNFEFTGLNLPAGAQMYIYNGAGTMFSGPIENKHVFEGQYSSDVIRGNEVVIAAIIPNEDFESFTIHVSNVIHGFLDFSQFDKDRAEERGYNDSQICEVDVNCPAGAGWENQRDAVAFTYVDNIELCSGTLINNACQDLNAFFLTAFHCLPGASGFLNWTFRFNYNSPNPVVPTCRGAEPTTWITYSGANLRAAWETTDFALLQLTGSLVSQPTIALAGWNNAPTIPTQTVTGIHHPAGDVKKISSDNEPLDSSDPNFWLIDQWDSGLVEHGSSGSALFDASQRIIGQLQGGDGNIGCIDGHGLVDNNTYGRLSVSWTGGGASTTRLSDWLGGTGPTMDLIRSPFINVPGPVCTANQSYTLENLIPGRTATWEVTPANLFTTGSGAATSGTGTTATLRAASASTSGVSTLTFTISAPVPCSTVVVSTPVWVGPPSATLDGDDYLCNSEWGIASLDYVDATAPIQGISSIVWSYSGPLSFFHGGQAVAKYQASARETGFGNINVSLTNACGAIQLSLPYEVADCEEIGGEFFSVHVFPNPSKGTMSIAFPDTETTGGISDRSYTPAKTPEIFLYDRLGRLALRQMLEPGNPEISTAGLLPGLYILEARKGETRSRTKITIVK